MSEWKNTIYRNYEIKAAITTTYLGMTLSATEGQIKKSATDHARVVGTNYSITSTAGNEVKVAVAGFCKVKMDGTTAATAGYPIMFNTSARGEGGAAAGNHCLGICFTHSPATGDIVECLIDHQVGA